MIGQLSQGGAERQLYELVRGLAPDRFRCVVYCLSEHTDPYGRLLEGAGADVRVLRRQGHFGLGRVARLAGLMRRDRLDIVNAFLFSANGYAWAAGRLAGTPSVVTSARNCRSLGRVRDGIIRVAFRASDAIVANGDAVKAFVIGQYRAPADRIAVIHNGVDLARFSGPVGDGAPPREPSIITVGRLVAQKDLGLYLEAAALLGEKRANARFLVVGDGPDRDALVRDAARLGLADRVAFLGERSDVPALLRRADVFWLTSAWEGFPNVVLEAMASGMPVVARDVGACREAIRDGVTGYLVGGRAPRAFADYTLALLADPARAREMGRAGRSLVEERFSTRAMIAATESLYHSLVGAASPGGAHPRRKRKTGADV